MNPVTQKPNTSPQGQSTGLMHSNTSEGCASILDAIEDLKQGRMLILVDDAHRENEGDLIVAAEKITPETINFMRKYTSCIICVAASDEIIQRFDIPMMPLRNNQPHKAAFTISVEAAKGVTTGVSSADRAKTIQLFADPKASAQDLSTPGHIFPLKAAKGGVLERQGHTEGSVDLMKLAGLQPAAAICEIMNPDGTMSRFPDLIQFAKDHDIKIVAIQDIIAYRLANESIIEEVATADLSLEKGNEFTIKVFHHHYEDAEHLALVHKQYDPSQSPLVRIHSECLTGDVFGSRRCDCGAQLNQAMDLLAEQKGILIYLRQEGRGIGLSNKVKAYHLQQTQGMDTVEANQHLGFKADHRSYAVSAQILKKLGVSSIRLLTNNPNKIAELQCFGIQVIERVPLETTPNAENQKYLKAKREKLGHLLNF